MKRKNEPQFDYLGGSMVCLLNWTQTITALHRQLYLPAKYVTHNKHMLLTDKGQEEVVTVGGKEERK